MGLEKAISIVEISTSEKDFKAKLMEAMKELLEESESSAMAMQKAVQKYIKGWDYMIPKRGYEVCRLHHLSSMLCCNHLSNMPCCNHLSSTTRCLCYVSVDVTSLLCVSRLSR